MCNIIKQAVFLKRCIRRYAWRPEGNAALSTCVKTSGLVKSEFADFFVLSHLLVCMFLYTLYGFYFLIEKRIILFKKIITFFTIKIFKNLDNKNLNVFMRFFADFRRSTDNLPWKYRVPLTNQRRSFVLAFYFWIFKNPQKCVIFRDISMFFQWF